MKLAHLLLILTVVLGAAEGDAQGLKALFDNTKNETAGNADWIIDTHQPVPSPAQSGITQSTPETFWTGAISSWGIDLVRQGFTVHTLTTAYGISYGNAGNPYDLSNYKVFIVCEPQGPFSAAEKAAIRSFVQNGGGLFMVADHNGSDRNSDGWDSPMVWNDLRSDSLFGIHFQSTGESNNNISQVAMNLAAASDPIIAGPAGTVTSLSYHNGTTMNLLTAKNPAAAGHIWMNSAAHGTSQVVAATSRYGLGKVAGVGDSSPADDGTGQSGNSLYNGWREAGATDNILFLNLTLWLTSTDAPAQVTLISPPDLSTNVAVPVKFSWHSAAGAAAYQFDLSTSNSFSTLAGSDSTLTDTTYTSGALAGGIQYYWRVRAKNGSGWGLFSSAMSFATSVTSHTITASAGPGGSIMPSGAVSVVAGADRKFTITPVTGYHRDSLIVDGVSGPVESTYTFINVSGDHAIRAAFAIDTFRISISAGPHGSVSPSGVIPAVFGSDVVCTIAPDSTFAIDTIFIDGLPADTIKSPVILSRIAANHSVSVTFRYVGVTVDIPIRSRWNLVSVPVHVSNFSASSLFPSARSRAFAFNGVYQAEDTLRAGIGYWLEFDHDVHVSQSGAPESEDSIPVVQGWNLIGSISVPVPVTSVIGIPPGLVVSRFFGYASGYLVADTIFPGLGYWVKAAQSGTLLLSSSPPLHPSSRVNILPTAESPPAPP